MRYIHVYQPDFGMDERKAIVNAVYQQEFLTANILCRKFEQEVANFHNRRHGVFVNSGSSAVLVAFAAFEHKRGAKILTPACTFGTTLSPIIQAGCIPVFVDVEPGTYNINPHQALEVADEVDGAVIPNTLGNPVANIWTHLPNTVEDACDAWGSTLDGQLCGTFGKLSAFSFFPAHHLTTVEGGMVLTNHYNLWRDAQRYSRWGRDCYCDAGMQGAACGNRWGHTLEDGSPVDHRYLFSKAGYNVRGDELRAAVGLTQIRKVGQYEAIRKRNFGILDNTLRPLDDVIIPPQALSGAEPSWFAYPITIRAEGKREEVVQAIEAAGVQTRQIFCGDATLHPFMRGVEHLAPYGLENSRKVARDAFCVGVNQMISEEEAHYMASVLKEVLTSV